jgi:regulator of nonsense transcripts 2
MKRLDTFPEAAAAVDVLLAEQSARGDADDAESDDGSDGEGEGGRGGAEEDEEEDEVGPVIVAGDHLLPLSSPTDSQTHAHAIEVERPDVDSDGPEDDIVVLRDKRAQPDEGDLEAAQDFDREFAKMLADTTDARRGERGAKAAPIFDMAVPHIKRGGESVDEAAGAGAGAGAGGQAGGKTGGMQFSLLSKRGNRQQVSGRWACA